MELCIEQIAGKEYGPRRNRRWHRRGCDSDRNVLKDDVGSLILDKDRARITPGDRPDISAHLSSLIGHCVKTAFASDDL